MARNLLALQVCALIAGAQGLAGCAHQQAHPIAAARHQSSAEWQREAAEKEARFAYSDWLSLCEGWLQDQPHDTEASLCVAAASNALADLEHNEEACESHLVRSLAVLEKLHMDSASQPADARAQFLYAEALGLRVRQHPSLAITLLGELHQHALAAYRTDRRIRNGAPIRLLGMLLSKAPPWPQGPGDPDEGMKLLDEALAAFPDRPEAYAHKAEVLLDQSRIKEAEQWLTQATKRQRSDPRAQKIIHDVGERMHRHHRVKSY